MANTTNTKTQKPQNEAARAKLDVMTAREADYFNDRGPRVYFSRTARLYMRLLADRVERPYSSGPFSSWERRARFGVRAGHKFGTSKNGPRQPSGKQWFEDYESAGLYLLDYCDQIARIDHNGWFVDNYQYDTIRGAVFVVNGRDPRGGVTLVAGYEDHNNPGAALLDWTSTASVDAKGEPLDMCGLHGTDEAADVARWADQLAESDAEEMREDDAKYRAEEAIHDLKDDMETARKELRALLAELRDVCPALGQAPHVIAALRHSIGELREQRREALQRIADLRDNYWNAVPY